MVDNIRFFFWKNQIKRKIIQLSIALCGKLIVDYTRRLALFADSACLNLFSNMASNKLHELLSGVTLRCKNR